MWTFFHKLGSPPWLFSISGTILRWLLPITLVALAVGLIAGTALMSLSRLRLHRRARSIERRLAAMEKEKPKLSSMWKNSIQ